MAVGVGVGILVGVWVTTSGHTSHPLLVTTPVLLRLVTFTFID